MNRSKHAPADRPADAPTAVESTQRPSFPIVGIGASAGGLAAFQAFLSAIPVPDPGMAFVLVQHLAPDHKSLLTELASGYTRMPVFEVEDGMPVRPNCVYIIPPNRDMALLDGTLQLLEPVAPRGHRLAIDFFFRSLAQDQHERAIGIVLSGTGSDGTLGIRAIKGEGGMAMAQAPETTEFDGMPRSAIATGLVDFIVPPTEMPAHLIGYAAQALGRASRSAATTAAPQEDALKKIFVVLRAQTGHDFSRYKQNTISRRVERRMAVHQIDGLDGYVRFLQQSPPEVDALFRDMLIGVTNFFRDPAAFVALQEHVIPRLFAAKAPGSSIRVWVPGCSTGEEAYSIAILLQEQAETLRQGFKLQVFATDIDRHAIDQARSGIYPASVAADVSADRLARFFVLEPDGGFYRIQKSLRDVMIFSEQDVIKDPPFSRLDLVSCRNLLIYMGPELQRKIIPLFHYALAPDGFLFLGTSETIGEFSTLFDTVDRKAKLYRRRDEAVTRSPSLPRFHPPAQSADVRPPARPSRDAGAMFRDLAERALLQHYGAVAALVDARGDILYLHGRSGRYLEPAPGGPESNILKMAREGLKHPLTAALRQAATRQEVVDHQNLRVRTNGDFASVSLTVRRVTPDRSETAESVLLLVVLEEGPPAGQPAPQAAESSPISESGAREVDARIAMLRRELQAKEESLQTTNEELETANEELKSSNEEMQSVNEELQSTNEELETSKEELQSVNEELSTVNAELQSKVLDLSQSNNDLNNLMAGTGVGTVFVDYQLNIKRFTPAATQLINLIGTDVGRPVGHVVSNLVGYHRLVEDVQAVLDTLMPKEIEVETKTGSWFLMRIRPYRTLENVIEGAVITFAEVTEMKKARALIEDAKVLRRLAVVVRDTNDAMMMLDLDGAVRAWNPGAARVYGWTEPEALALNIRDLAPDGQRDGALAAVREQSRAALIAPVRVERRTKDGRTIAVSLTASQLVNTDGTPYAVATTERPII